MPNYDFKQLSPLDFEDLSRDLLQAELGITFESFKPGRDGGIDSRHCSAKGDIIIQAKHYARSKFSDLKNNLKKTVKNLKAESVKRYILTTSLPLSANDKDQLKDVLRNLCDSVSDIYGLEDLNNLLGKYEEVERRNYKLWINSTGQIEQVLHREIYNNNRFEIDQIGKSMLVYVKNDSFNEALEILENSNVCIITGNPGIGKTTLARALMATYMREGFELCFMKDAESGGKQFKTEGRQIFYYDDFLGATYRDRNESRELLNLIDTISNLKDKRFVLTTRDYILNQAREDIELFWNSKVFDVYKCTVELQDYSTSQKAEILFNHLYYSDLSVDDYEDVLNEKVFRKIISHQSYTPRIVNYMSTIWSTENSTGKFAETFLKNLENPNRIWEKAFKDHICVASQNLLLILFSLPSRVEVSDLKKAFDVFNKNRCLEENRQSRIDDFQRALKELENSFISIDAYGEKRLVGYSNPSVADYIHTYLSEYSFIFSIMSKSFIFYEQCLFLMSISQKESIGVIDEKESNRLMNKLMSMSQCKIIERIEKNGKATIEKEIAEAPNFIPRVFEWMNTFNISKIPFSLVKLASNLIKEMDESPEYSWSSNSIIAMLSTLKHSQSFENKDNLITSAIRCLKLRNERLSDYERFCYLQELYPERISNSVLFSKMKELEEMYISDLVDYPSHTDEPYAIEIYINTVKDISFEFRLNLEDAIAELNEIYNLSVSEKNVSAKSAINVYENVMSENEPKAFDPAGMIDLLRRKK